MKNYFLSTVAFVALSTTAATMASAEAPKFSFGGSVGVVGGYLNDDAKDLGLDRKKYDALTDAELNFGLTGTANTLHYGAHVSLSSDFYNAVEFDKAYVKLGTAQLGHVELGDVDGAAERMSVYAPVVGLGQIDNEYFQAFANGYGSDHLLGGQPWGDATKVPHSGNMTKLSYYSPSLGGLTVGASFTPNADFGYSADRSENFFASGVYESVTEVAANYNTKLNADTSLVVGASYAYGVAQEDNMHDYNAWSLGAKVAYKQFDFGGGYVDAGKFGYGVGADTPDQNAWNLGVGYTFDNTRIGASYLTSKGLKESLGSTYADDHTLYAVGVTHAVSDALDLSADVIYLDEELNSLGTKSKNTGLGVMVGTQIKF